MSPVSSCIADRFFTTDPPGKPPPYLRKYLFENLDKLEIFLWGRGGWQEVTEGVSSHLVT